MVSGEKQTERLFLSSNDCLKLQQLKPLPESLATPPRQPSLLLLLFSFSLSSSLSLPLSTSLSLSLSLRQDGPPSLLSDRLQADA